MKKVVKNIFLVFAIIILGIVTYYVVVVMKARIDTPKIVEQVLKSDNITLEVKDLSPWQLNALLAIEDPNFYGHNGIDLKTPGAGITTITQGLVKKYYFKSFKAGIAKVKQTFVARFALNPLVSKDDQLKLFINNVYLGNVRGQLVIGFDNAARIYYNKPVNKLSEDEYLSIVAMIVAPKTFNILNKPEANKERTRRIKKVVSGEYKPKTLMDIYYGTLDSETIKELAPVSYFQDIYKQ